MSGFFEYFFNFSIVVFRTKLNTVPVCWKPWPFSWILLLKQLRIWLVLGGFFCVFSQSETICNLHSCYKFALVLITEELHSFLSQSEFSNFFVYIVNHITLCAPHRSKKSKKEKENKKKGYEKFAEGYSNFRVSPNQLELKVNPSNHWTASVKGKKYS